jgi:hypothetical protein
MENIRASYIFLLWKYCESYVSMNEKEKEAQLQGKLLLSLALPYQICVNTYAYVS